MILSTQVKLRLEAKRSLLSVLESLKGTGQGGLTVGKKEAASTLLTFPFRLIGDKIHSVNLSFVLQIFLDDGMLHEKHYVKRGKEAKTNKTTAAAAKKKKKRELSH